MTPSYVHVRPPPTSRRAPLTLSKEPQKSQSFVPETPPSPGHENLPPLENQPQFSPENNTERFSCPKQSTVAELDALIEKHCERLEQDLQKQYSDMRNESKYQGKKLDDISRQLKENEDMLSAMALYVASQNPIKKIQALRSQTAAQLSTFKKYLNSDVLSKSGCHIVGSYGVVYVKESDMKYETALVILELLLFTPPAVSRRVKRHSKPGKAFQDMRYLLMYNYVQNCRLQVEVSREQVREVVEYITIAQDREATSLSVENHTRGFETAIELAI